MTSLGYRLGITRIASGSVVSVSGNTVTLAIDGSNVQRLYPLAFPGTPATGTPMVVKFDPVQQREVAYAGDYNSGSSAASFPGSVVTTGSGNIPQTASSFADGAVIPKTTGLVASAQGIEPYLLWYGQVVEWKGADVDFASLVPGTSGQHLAAIAALNPLRGRVLTLTSTAKSTAVDITSGDVQEAWGTRTLPLLPLGGFVLTNGDTSLADSQRLDVRQLMLSGQDQHWAVEVDDTTYTVKQYDRTVMVDHTATAAVTVTLPSVASRRLWGAPATIIDSGENANTNNITITASGSDTIQTGGSSITTDGGSVTLWAHPSQDKWFIS